MGAIRKVLRAMFLPVFILLMSSLALADGRPTHANGGATLVEPPVSVRPGAPEAAPKAGIRLTDRVEAPGINVKRFLSRIDNLSAKNSCNSLESTPVPGKYRGFCLIRSAGFKRNARGIVQVPSNLTEKDFGDWQRQSFDAEINESTENGEIGDDGEVKGEPSLMFQIPFEGKYERLQYWPQGKEWYYRVKTDFGTEYYNRFSCTRTNSGKDVFIGKFSTRSKYLWDERVCIWNRL